jgi:hypothetical protein
MAKTPTDAPVLTYVNRLLGASLMGGQLVWTIAVLPTYEKLEADEYLKVHTLLTWYGDALMPSLGLGSTLSGYLRYRRTGEPNALVGAVALTGASIAAARNLRINTRMRELRAGQGPTPTPGADTTALLHHEKKMWAAQHLIRTVGGVLAGTAYLLSPIRRLQAGRPKASPFGLIDPLIGLIALRSGKEIVGHLAMMRGKGKYSSMRQSLGIVTGAAATASSDAPSSQAASPASADRRPPGAPGWKRSRSMSGRFLVARSLAGRRAA